MGRNYPLYSSYWGNFRSPRPRSLAKSVLPLQERASGEMAEWLKAHAWKACVRETVPWVRIPLSPPSALCATIRYPSPWFTKPHRLSHILLFWSLDRFAVLRHNPPNNCGQDSGLMARAIGRLTALKVDKLKEPGMYADGGGLYLRVTPGATKGWVYDSCWMAGRDGWAWAASHHWSRRRTESGGNVPNAAIRRR